MKLTIVTFDLIKLAYLAGYLLILYGLFALFFPRALIRINNYVNRFLGDLDSKTTDHRVITGICTLIVGIAIIFTLSFYV